MRALFTFADPPTEHELHLSCESSASSYGQPVVVNEAGEAIDLTSWAFYRVTWASDPEAAAFQRAGYPLRWGLTFKITLPHVGSYWGSACDAPTAERACDIAEAAIRSHVNETWPGACYQFLPWRMDGGLPPLSVEPGGPDSAYAGQLDQFVERHFAEWAAEAAELVGLADLGDPPTHGPGDPHRGEKAWARQAAYCEREAANAAGRLGNQLEALAHNREAESAADDVTRAGCAEAVRTASEAVGQAWAELFARMRLMEDWHSWPLVPEDEAAE